MEKINWTLIISIISPIVMAISLIATAAVYKDRLDKVTSYFTPQWFEDYGAQQVRITELEKDVETLQEILRQQYLRLDGQENE